MISDSSYRILLQGLKIGEDFYQSTEAVVDSGTSCITFPYN